MDSIDDAIIAAVAYIVEHLAMLAADRGRQKWFFWDVLVAYAAVFVAEERKQLAARSDN